MPVVQECLQTASAFQRTLQFLEIFFRDRFQDDRIAVVEDNDSRASLDPISLSQLYRNDDLTL